MQAEQLGLDSVAPCVEEAHGVSACCVTWCAFVMTASKSPQDIRFKRVRQHSMTSSYSIPAAGGHNLAKFTLVP